MKTKNKYMGELVEVVFPFAGMESLADADGLFDDCPLCQDLRERLRRGEVEVELDARKANPWEKPN